MHFICISALSTSLEPARRCSGHSVLIATGQCLEVRCSWMLLIIAMCAVQDAIIATDMASNALWLWLAVWWILMQGRRRSCYSNLDRFGTSSRRVSSWLCICRQEISAVFCCYHHVALKAVLWHIAMSFIGTSVCQSHVSELIYQIYRLRLGVFAW